jgi:hypothetical protein
MQYFNLHTSFYWSGTVLGVGQSISMGVWWKIKTLDRIHPWYIKLERIASDIAMLEQRSFSILALLWECGLDKGLISNGIA